MIIVQNLNKNYGHIEALKNINFSIAKGELVFLLGPNGAGKSTLMKLLTGYLSQESGNIEIFGRHFDKSAKEILSDIGYVPENTPLYNEMSVYEYLDFLGKIRRLDSQKRQERIKELSHLFDLTSVLNQKCETLSKGYKKRTAIAGGLMSNPKILILDEPTEGLDPNQKFTIRNFFKEYAKENIVIISTHVMEEVTAFPSRVILLNKGRLIEDTSAQELSKLSPQNDLEEAFRQITGK